MLYIWDELHVLMCLSLNSRIELTSKGGATINWFNGLLYTIIMIIVLHTHSCPSYIADDHHVYEDEKYHDLLSHNCKVTVFDPRDNQDVSLHGKKTMSM